MIFIALGALAADSLSPLSGSDIMLRLLAVFLLIAINAFFVAAEFSIVSVRRSRINQLASAGDIQAKTVQDLQRGLDRLLSTTQLGITLSSLALGWIGEGSVAMLLGSWVSQWSLSETTREFIVHSIAVPAAFLLIAYLQIVLGELCPKSVALLYPEQLARLVGAPSLVIARLFNPFIWILNQSTRWLLRLVGIQYTGQGWTNRVTPEELQLIISTSTESPGLEEEKRELLTNVFEFAEVTAGEVMVPRTSIVAISKDATFQEFLHEVVESGHSRYPVMGESLDDIQGIIHFKELAKPVVDGLLTLESSIQSWLRPAQFVSETIALDELLRSMRRGGQAMVVVVDEYGGTAGLVTLQDLVAEIIGDTPEPEGSDEEPTLQILDEQTFLVQAQTNLEEVNELLDLNFPLAEDYQTLGGFIIFQLQKIPAVGEKLYYEAYEITIESAEGPRLERVRIHRNEPLLGNQTDTNDDLFEPMEAIDPVVSPVPDPWDLPSAPQTTPDPSPDSSTPDVLDRAKWEATDFPHASADTPLEGETDADRPSPSQRDFQRDGET